MKKFIVFVFVTIFFLMLTLQAKETNQYAMVLTYEIDGEIIHHESNRSNTIFKDINVTFSLLKSSDEAISIENIRAYDADFSAIAKKEEFQDSNVRYWLKVDLGKSFPSGRFICSYADANFTNHTFAPSQQLDRFQLNGPQHIAFSYTHGVDTKVYYFKLQPRYFRIPFRFVSISTPETFYTQMSLASTANIYIGLILGLILMAAIYNGAMYFYNRDHSFLYYTLMQLFIFAILYDSTEVYLFEVDSFFSRNMHYGYLIALGATLFATLFNMYFLDTKKHLPKFHLYFKVTLFLIGVDMLVSLFDKSYIDTFHLYPFIMLAFLYTGFNRLFRGYKPARYYLAGWILLTIAVFIDVFDILSIDSLYFGAATEAILFSFALSYKVHMLDKAKEEQKELLVHQSKLASMGEMIGNIAHQWRQPLTHLSYTFMNIEEAQKHGELDEVYLQKKIDEANTQLKFMSDTIEDFQSFYSFHKEKEEFSLRKATKETLEIMGNIVQKSGIEVELVIKDECLLFNHKNEYKQVLLNLISNAKEALLEKELISPKITITIDDKSVWVQDNAGGINEKIIKRIFEPYFSTKERSSGIGLYMSQMIVQKKLGAILRIENSKRGVKASIIFSKKSRIV